MLRGDLSVESEICQIGNFTVLLITLAQESIIGLKYRSSRKKRKIVYLTCGGRNLQFLEEAEEQFDARKSCQEEIVVCLLH